MRRRNPAPLFAAAALAFLAAALAVPVLGCALPRCSEMAVAADHGCCEPAAELSGPSCCGQEVSAAEGRPGRLPALDRMSVPVPSLAAVAPQLASRARMPSAGRRTDASPPGAHPEALYTLFSCLLI